MSTLALPAGLDLYEDVLLLEIDDTLMAIDTALVELERKDAVRSPGPGKRDRIAPRSCLSRLAGLPAPRRSK